jgi:hypothetical protein
LGNFSRFLVVKGKNRMSSIEFFPRGRDYIFLAIGLFIKIRAVGLLVGEEDIKADPER